MRERLEIARETAEEAYAEIQRRYTKPIPPFTDEQPDPGYQLPAPTIAGMVQLCGERRRQRERDRDTALPAERERKHQLGLFKR